MHIDHVEDDLRAPSCLRSDGALVDPDCFLSNNEMRGSREDNGWGGMIDGGRDVHINLDRRIGEYCP